MSLIIEEINENTSRLLYWTRIHIILKDMQATVYACTSEQYLDDHYKGDSRTKKIQSWRNQLEEKWMTREAQLTDEFFELPNHFDIYTNTKDGESNCLNFLLSIAQP